VTRRRAFVRSAVFSGPGACLILGTPNKEMSSPVKERSSNRFHEKEFYFPELRDLLQTFFAWVVIIENTGASVSELGRRMRADRVARGEVGFETGDRETASFDDLVVDLRPLRNVLSFIALAR
jgi:hypothetical protein